MSAIYREPNLTSFQVVNYKKDREKHELSIKDAEYVLEKVHSQRGEKFKLTDEIIAELQKKSVTQLINEIKRKNLVIKPKLYHIILQSIKKTDDNFKSLEYLFENTKKDTTPNPDVNKNQIEEINDCFTQLDEFKNTAKISSRNVFEATSMRENLAKTNRIYESLIKTKELVEESKKYDFYLNNMNFKLYEFMDEINEIIKLDDDYGRVKEITQKLIQLTIKSDDPEQFEQIARTFYQLEKAINKMKRKKNDLEYYLVLAKQKEMGSIYKELLNLKKCLYVAYIKWINISFMHRQLNEWMVVINELIKLSNDFIKLKEIVQKLIQITKEEKQPKIIKNSFFYNSFIRKVKNNNGFYYLAQKAFDEATSEKKVNRFMIRDFIYASIRNNELKKVTEMIEGEGKRNLVDFEMSNTMVEIFKEMQINPEKSKKFFYDRVLPFIEQKKENTYDLHDLSYASAIYYLEQIKNTAQKNIGIKIITGYGAHSKKEENIQKMKKLTIDFCSENDQIRILNVGPGHIDIIID